MDPETSITNRGQVLLEPTSGENKEEIVRAINKLTPGGSTNAAEGLTLGYAKNVQPGRISRVIRSQDLGPGVRIE